MCCLILAAHTYPVGQEMLKSIQKPKAMLLEVGKKRRVHQGAEEGQVQAEATECGRQKQQQGWEQAVREASGQLQFITQTALSTLQTMWHIPQTAPTLFSLQLQKSQC